MLCRIDYKSTWKGQYLSREKFIYYFGSKLSATFFFSYLLRKTREACTWDMVIRRLLLLMCHSTYTWFRAKCSRAQMYTGKKIITTYTVHVVDGGGIFIFYRYSLFSLFKCSIWVESIIFFNDSKRWANIIVLDCRGGISTSII